MENKNKITGSERKDVIRSRIRELRNTRGWSLNKMGEQLNFLIGIESPRNVLFLDGKAGKETVSQLENGRRNITIELAVAYAEIFGISLDYILGISDAWQHQNKSIKENTGLTDKALEKMNSIKNSDNSELELLVLNKLFENGFIEKFIKVTLSNAENIVLLNLLEGIEEHLKDMLKENAETSLWKLSILTSNALRSLSEEISQIKNDHLIRNYLTALNNIGFDKIEDQRILKDFIIDLQKQIRTQINGEVE